MTNQNEKKRQTDQHGKSVPLKPHTAFLGLGTMGYPMAGHLSKAGYPVTVCNRTRSKAEQWVRSFSGQLADSPEEATTSADVIFTCLGNDNDVREVYSTLLKTAAPGTVLVDHTTTSANLAKELGAKAKLNDLHFLDAPVSGGEIGAEQGTLTVMIGGDKTSYDAISPLIDSYAKTHTLIGPQGYGQLCKMINQICVAGVLQGLAEGLQLAKAHGIEASTIVNTLGHGAASSWQLTHRTETMLRDEFDFGFAIDWMRKDLAICLQEATKQGIALPMCQLVDHCYAELQQKGFGRSDTSALIKQFD